MIEHTKGPWAWRGPAGKADLQSAIGPVMFYYGYEGLSFSGTEEEIEANAMLVAAAPELLEALRQLVNCIMDTRGPDAHHALALARAALEKAGLKP